MTSLHLFVVHWKLFSVIVQRDSNMWLSLGGFQEKGPDDEHLRNSHVLVDDTGTIRSVFRKMHLWDSLFWFSMSLLLCLNSTLFPNVFINANGISRDRISCHMLQSYRVNFLHYKSEPGILKYFKIWRGCSWKCCLQREQLYRSWYATL